MGGELDAGGASIDCSDLVSEFPSSLEEAKKCDPALSVEQCVLLAPSGLVCGCVTFVNPKNVDASNRVLELSKLYVRGDCGGDIACGACLDPLSGRCSAEGQCHDVFPGNGRSCKVAGITYPDGAGGIQHPDSPCNTCGCNDGELVCSKAACPSSCPAGTTFGRQCAECGPTDACLLPEYDCFTQCSDSVPCGTAGASCINGLCLTGICG